MGVPGGAGGVPGGVPGGVAGAGLGQYPAAAKAAKYGIIKRINITYIKYIDHQFSYLLCFISCHVLLLMLVNK